MSIVADSGRLLSFARANRLELLHQVISDLTIPDAVYAGSFPAGSRSSTS
jgi:predicted nucleic acid-binding protein